ncbi:MAG: 50S ribosomal protein L30 [Desulfurococcales archaeon]|nr:50S ribosomal protein L30 [Desulfurococcales archaeon]
MIAIIRLRGRVDVPPDVEYTLRLLRLYRKFHMTVYPSELQGLEGMLLKAQHWITWGEIDLDVLKEVLKKRGEVPGGKRLNDEYVKNRLGFNSIDELAEALYNGKIYLHKISDYIKPVFRLHPPKKGFKRSIKKPFGAGGETGYRGREINELIKRMI